MKNVQIAALKSIDISFNLFTERFQEIAEIFSNELIAMLLLPLTSKALLKLIHNLPEEILSPLGSHL